MNKNFIVTAITAMTIASQLCGCNNDKTSPLVKSMEEISQNNSEVEIIVNVPKDIKNGEEELPYWGELEALEDQKDLRNFIDKQLKIRHLKTSAYDSSKNGVMYVDPETENWESNNTLENVFKNKKFVEYFDNAEVQNAIQEEARKTYCDLDDKSSDTVRLAALNAYFNIFADDERNGYFNGDSTLTRAEFMSGLIRASVKYDQDAKPLPELLRKLGYSRNIVYAENVNEALENCYLTVDSGDLDKLTFNGKITRAEAIYMLVNKYYPEELKNEIEDGETYSDCKNAGDVLEGTEYTRKVALRVMLDNPTEGIEENLYKALKLAYDHKLLTEDGKVLDESRWNEALTKAEALQMIVNVYRDLGTTISCDRGNNDPEDMKAAKEKKILTYEEFAAAVGYDDMPLFSEEDKKEYYDGYVVSANWNDTDIEALEDEYKSMIPEIYEKVKARHEENEKIREQEQTEQRGTGDTDDITGGNQPTVDQTPADNTPQTPVISDEEAKKKREEYNRRSAGHTGDTSGCPANVLTDEERKERQEEFNIQAY